MALSLITIAVVRQIVATYDGPAVIVLADGVRCRVTVVLRTAELVMGAVVHRVWSGIARNARQISLHRHRGQLVAIELANGRTGQALIAAVSGPPLDELVEVRGSGPPPF